MIKIVFYINIVFNVIIIILKMILNDFDCIMLFCLCYFV